MNTTKKLPRVSVIDNDPPTNYNYIVEARLANGKKEVLHRCNSQAEAKRIWGDHYMTGRFVDVWWTVNSDRTKPTRKDIRLSTPIDPTLYNKEDVLSNLDKDW